eukprot:CAMPEP_0182448672 /NCGR_PEP_ID=MMETSP1172-20130603/28692_1 /TAXON_ID=708627 /ORGANISM="Timspurckia oligopyrenoides, Strain CCMP3278" /LENGTH=256 /DNA_ID=CAMNT_0024645623 /DNA_START=150 /DNA_END=920 /DNA_ORIENTATION=-
MPTLNESQGNLIPDHPTDVDFQQCANALRSGKKGDMQRALVLVRNMNASDSIALLEIALESGNEFIRATATVMLGQVPCDSLSKEHQTCLNRLITLVQNDSDYGVRSAAAAGLGYLGDTSALETLVRIYHEDVEWQVQFSALVALGDLRDSRAIPTLVSALSSSNAILVQGAVGALGDIADKSVLETLLTMSERIPEDVLTTQRLAVALGAISMELEGEVRLRSIAALKRLFQHPHQLVKEAAFEALLSLGEMDIL